MLLRELAGAGLTDVSGDGENGISREPPFFLLLLFPAALFVRTALCLHRSYSHVTGQIACTSLRQSAHTRKTHLANFSCESERAKLTAFPSY